MDKNIAFCIWNCWTNRKIYEESWQFIMLTVRNFKKFWNKFLSCFTFCNYHYRTRNICFISAYIWTKSKSFILYLSNCKNCFDAKNSLAVYCIQRTSLDRSRAAYNMRLGKSWAWRIWAKQYIFNETIKHRLKQK